MNASASNPTAAFAAPPAQQRDDGEGERSAFYRGVEQKMLEQNASKREVLKTAAQNKNLIVFADYDATMTTRYVPASPTSDDGDASSVASGELGVALITFVLSGFTGFLDWR